MAIPVPLPGVPVSSLSDADQETIRALTVVTHVEFDDRRRVSYRKTEDATWRRHQTFKYRGASLAVIGGEDNAELK